VSPLRSWRAWVATVLACAAPLLAAEAPPPSGLKVATVGHSFHVWMAPLVAQMAKAAGIVGHEQLATSFIGGSKVVQHWDLPPAKDKVKPLLEAGRLDVFTMSPAFLPDPGMERFIRLGLGPAPRLRFTIQQNWVPYDDPALWYAPVKPKVVERDAATLPQLRAKHDPYFKAIEEQVRELRKQFPETSIVLVPCGEAVLRLRAEVIAGTAPGIDSQAQLFTDALGHPGPQIRVLAAYCHFATMYRRSPVGLPVPPDLARSPRSAELNRRLQEIAWEVVGAHPMSGVTR